MMRFSLTSEFKLIANSEEDLLSPEKIGMPRIKSEDISGGKTVEESVRIFLNVLEGKGTTQQNSVVITNSGFALRKLFPDKEIQECFEIAKDSLMTGKALNSFKEIIRGKLMNILEKIVAFKKEEVNKRKIDFPLSSLKKSDFYNRIPVSFYNALKKSEPAVIAEFKRKSPSKGIINTQSEPEVVARGYEDGGVAANVNTYRL